MKEEERKILERLLIDELKALEEIVQRAEKVLRINKHTGEAVILLPREKLSKKDLIALQVIARYFAFKLGLVTTDNITISEIMERTGIQDAKVISARLSDLRKDGILEQVEHGKYRVSVPNLSRYLDELIKKSKGESHEL